MKLLDSYNHEKMIFICEIEPWAMCSPQVHRKYQMSVLIVHFLQYLHYRNSKNY